jgi:hypothetical protein
MDQKGKVMCRGCQQLDKRDRLLELAEHRRRFAAMLDRWENQAQRIDSLLA